VAGERFGGHGYFLAGVLSCSILAESFGGGNWLLIY
jgi:hypothetical protein